MLSGELGATFGKAKNVIFLWLQGARRNTKHSTPNRRRRRNPRIRSSRLPPTSPGNPVLRTLAADFPYADQMAIVRVCPREINHDVSGYWLLTGYPYSPGSRGRSDRPLAVLRLDRQLLKPSETCRPDTRSGCRT